MEFSEIREVVLREAWPDEAKDFTPWLAHNLIQLSQAIGMELELEDTEVKVEQFSADILARNQKDDSLVLIENQLEGTDHTHLGQILTYLAGLDARTVIWIARQFREPHLSAIRWLNEHTIAPFEFFAVRVKVLRIGDDPSSPAAPLFEPLERPIGWDRKIRKETEGGLSALGTFRRDFWRFYDEIYPNDSPARGDNPNSNIKHRISGVIVLQSLHKDHVGVYLKEKQPADVDVGLVERLRGALRNEKNGESIHRLDVDTNDRNNWPKMAKWLHEELVEVRRILEGAVQIDGTTE